MTKPNLGGLGPATGSAWGAFLRAHAELIAVMNEELEAAEGIPISTYDVLRQLALAEGRRLRMAELAEHVMLSRPGLTGVVNRLEGAGLVRREPTPDDGRGFHAVITEEGLAVLERAHATHVASIKRHFAGRFEQDELRTLGELLGRLVR